MHRSILRDSWDFQTGQQAARAAKNSLRCPLTVCWELSAERSELVTWKKKMKEARLVRSAGSAIMGFIILKDLQSKILHFMVGEKKKSIFLVFFFYIGVWGNWKCLGEATWVHALEWAAVLPVCVISSDRTRPGKRLKSNIMKYLAGSSPLMGSRSAAGARAQQPKALRTDAELPGTDFYFYFYFYFYFFF